MRNVFLYLLLFPVFLASCLKQEEALVLPPAGSATHGMVDMGNDYETQVYYDLKTNSAVFSSDPASWDISFETGEEGKHIFLNGGHNIFVYNTHETVMEAVRSLPGGLNSNGTGWHFDAPSGNPDSTGFGEWYDEYGVTKREIYVLQLEPNRYIKMRVLKADDQYFLFEWAPLEGTAIPQSVKLTKNPEFNFIYFSFDKGTVNPEPPKNSWDLVFTRYRFVYHTAAYPNFPYEVTGVLLNPAGTLATMDSVHSFEQIDVQMASGMKLTNARDIIGFDWKTYNGSSGRYVVNRSKNFVIQTRDKQLYKLHFLDFYNNSGAKGSPSFEFERLK